MSASSGNELAHKKMPRRSSVWPFPSLLLSLNLIKRRGQIFINKEEEYGHECKRAATVHER